MTDEHLQWHIEEIKKLRKEAKAYQEDAPGAMVEKIRLLTAAHSLMGRVSAQMDGDYAKIYALRKNTFVLAKKNAPRGDKTLAAEEAIMQLRELEAEAYEQKMIWRNDLDSLREKIYELRMRVRLDMHIGGGING